jgi:hypothetical protein
MQWTELHRERLFHIIDGEWHGGDIGSFERYLADLGITWAELDEIHDAPEGTVAVWEGPGIENPLRKMCWIVPDEVALKMLALFP